MKTLINYILSLLLVFITGSCKGQIKDTHNSNQKIFISAIKDSVTCKDGNDSFKLVCSLPKINCDNKKHENSLNMSIYEQLQINNEFFEFLENDSLKVTTEDAIKLMFEKIRANCTPSYYGFGEINIYFNMLYNKKEFVSIEIYRESFFASFQQSITQINLNLNTGGTVTIENIIKLNKKELLIKKNNSIIQRAITDDLIDLEKHDRERYLEAVDNAKDYNRSFDLNDLNYFILTTKDNIDGLQFIFSLGYPQPFKASEPTFALFFSFDELKPYLTEEFKEQIGL